VFFAGGGIDGAGVVAGGMTVVPEPAMVAALIPAVHWLTLGRRRRKAG
jgi:hypothetical protein